MSWAILIPFCDEAEAKIAEKAINFAGYYYVVKSTTPPSASAAVPTSRAETIEAIVNAWPAEDQSQLYRLLYNAGIRINR